MIGKHLSLFSGVGMTDIAAEAAGFKTVAVCDNDPFCQRVLRARFPGAPLYKDVRDVSVLDDALRRATSEPLLITGGTPCQGFSDSGYGGGLSDPRSKLLLEMLRVVSEFRPDYVLIENSPLLLKRGGDKVIHRLMRMGYYVRWECIPAAYVGAPHMRDRVWIMARKYPWPGVSLDAPVGVRRLPRAGASFQGSIYATTPLTRRASAKAHAPRPMLPTPTRSDGTGGPGVTPKRTGGKNLRTVVAERFGNGRLNPVFVEWMMGLPLHWTDVDSAPGAVYPWDRWAYCGVPHTLQTLQWTTDKRVPNRSQRIQALGNGLVPQVASVALDILINQ